MKFIAVALTVAGLILATVMIKLVLPVEVLIWLPTLVTESLFPIASWGGMCGLAGFALYLRHEHEVTLDLCATA